MTHQITNKTTSMLDMSPHKDVFGKALTLRGNESREIDDDTFRSDVVQRMLKAQWIGEGGAAPAKPAAAVPPPAPTPSTPAAAVTPPLAPPVPPIDAVTPPPLAPDEPPTHEEPPSEGEHDAAPPLPPLPHEEHEEHK